MRQTPVTTHEARLLRRIAPAAEANLWPFLRARRLDGWKVRRCHPIGGRIASYYVDAARVAIEVSDRSDTDTWEESLSAQGVRLLRLAARDVLADPAGALAAIRKCLQSHEGRR